jgi:5-methylcytosine-specific restriction endonuclease McrA
LNLGEATMYNYDLLLKLTKEIPDELDKKVKKEPITPGVRETVVKRDCFFCSLCGSGGEYGYHKYGQRGNLSLHHIIPNGPATEENLITLCNHCHSVVHLILYTSGKWKWIPYMRAP